MRVLVLLIVFLLGGCVSSERSSNSAIERYRKAAEQGRPDVQHSLGLMFELGDGVVKNMPEAITCYTAAAKQRNAESQYVLGTIYESDKSEPLNLHLADMWYQSAAAH